MEEERQSEITAIFFAEKFPIANNHYQSGLFDEAEALCVWLAALDPGNFDVFHLWGLSLLQKEEKIIINDTASLFVLRAITIRPSYALIFRNIAVISRNKEQFAQAELFMRIALVVEPDNEGFHNEIGNIETDRSDVKHSSSRHYRRAIAIRPDLTDAYINLAVLVMAITGCERHIRKKTGLSTVERWQSTTSDAWYRMIFPGSLTSPWLNDMEFLSIYVEITDYTMVDIYRCYELWMLVRQSLRIEGDILEVGVWRGGTGAILSQAAKGSGKRVFLADTFSGVVKAGEKDTKYKGGEHADTSIKLVENLMESLSLRNIVLLNGIFPEDTQHLINGKISILHCDVDVYSSCKDVVEWCLPRLSVGSVLVFDDYGNHSCEGVTVFCNELREQRKDFSFIYNLNGHAIFTKIA